MPELLGDKDTLGEVVGDRAYNLSRGEMVDIFTDFLDNYPHHPVLFGKAVDLRGNSTEELHDYATWYINQVFAALDYDAHLGRVDGANPDELRVVLSS